MWQGTKFQIIVLPIFILLSGILIAPLSLSQPLHQTNQQSLIALEGQILYSPMFTTTTYLIDRDGSVNNTWGSIYLPGVSVWWLGDGTILRTIRLSGAPGGGGGVQIITKEGTILWDFRYNTDKVLSHHDVKSLPNGNVLLIAWEHKTREEVIEAGRNPDFVPSGGLSPDHIIEVKPTGPSSGEIVWEWHVWDHLIQDYDPSKANYGVVKDHPESVDINYITESQWDLMHTNSIDYNEEFDQLLISVCYYNEIWVIDHSTTIEEAASHTGGNSGKGGDILYRWGNPQTYDRGTSNDQRLFMQHDATWIKPGCPGEGNILVFNNEVNRHSSIDEISPPVNESGEYYLGENSSYGPVDTTWSYTAAGFYQGQFSGAIRLASGNTLITNGESGVLFEVNSMKETVWQYNTGVILFKVVYVPPEEPGKSNLDCEGSLKWLFVSGTQNGDFIVKNIGSANTVLNWTVISYPSWGIWSFNPSSGENLKPEDGQMIIQVSVVAPNEKNKEFQGFIKVINQENPSDYDYIPVYLRTPKKTNISFFKYLNNYIDIFLTLKLFLHRILK